MSLQQDDARPHFVRQAIPYPIRHCEKFCIGWEIQVPWPPRSCDLSTLGTYEVLVWYMKCTRPLDTINSVT